MESRRLFERVQFVFDVAIGGRYDVGPSVEDGTIYVWKHERDTRKVIAGPFVTNDDGVAWVMKLVENPLSERTPGF